MSTLQSHSLKWFCFYVEAAAAMIGPQARRAIDYGDSSKPRFQGAWYSIPQMNQEGL